VEWRWRFRLKRCPEQGMAQPLIAAVPFFFGCPRNY
jgi:hypothetical protein